MAKTPSARWPYVASTLAAIGVFAVLPEWAILTRTLRDCQTHYDFGIYVQALSLFRWNDWNPWLSARGLYIFNDHFDPVLLVATIPRLFMSASLAGWATETAFVVGSALLAMRQAMKMHLDAAFFAAVPALLLLNIGTHDAVQFPIHPTTWAVFPMVGLCFALEQKNRASTVGFLLLLFSCKEEFALCGLAVAAVMFAQRERRDAVLIGGLSAATLAFTFFVRPLLMGPTEAYATHFVDGLFSHPVDFVVQRFRHPDVRRAGTWALTVVPLVFVSIRARVAPNWKIVAMLAPMLAVRWVSERWLYQYGAVVVVAAVLAFLPLGRQRTSRWLPVACLLMLALTTPKRWKFDLESLSGNFIDCPTSPERAESLDRGVALLLQDNEPAVVSGNLVARLGARPNIYSFTSSDIPAGVTLRRVLLEKPPHGSAWPFEHVVISKFIERERGEPDTRVLLDDDNVFVAEGVFDRAPYD